MSQQTPAEQPLDIITQLTVRPASTKWEHAHSTVWTDEATLKCCNTFAHDTVL